MNYIYVCLKNEEIRLIDLLEGSRYRKATAEKIVVAESEVISDLVNKIKLLHAEMKNKV